MIYAVDACTFINLANSGELATVIRLPNYRFLISRAVKRESATIADALEQAISVGILQEINDSALSAFAFEALKEEFQLGDGETECLLAAQIFGCNIACDDLAARKAATKLLGPTRLIGSIGLLKQCVMHELLEPSAAFAAYQAMKSYGGFLPSQSLNDFEV